MFSFFSSFITLLFSCDLFEFLLTLSSHVFCSSILLCLYFHSYSFVLPFSINIIFVFIFTLLLLLPIYQPITSPVIYLWFLFLFPSPYFVSSPFILLIPFSICFSSHLFRSPALFSRLPRLSFNLPHPISFLYSSLLIPLTSPSLVFLGSSPLVQYGSPKFRSLQVQLYPSSVQFRFNVTLVQYSLSSLHPRSNALQVQSSNPYSTNFISPSSVSSSVTFKSILKFSSVVLNFGAHLV